VDEDRPTLAFSHNHTLVSSLDFDPPDCIAQLRREEMADRQRRMSLNPEQWSNLHEVDRQNQAESEPIETDSSPRAEKVPKANTQTR
jgi:hypothetical protein